MDNNEIYKLAVERLKISDPEIFIDPVNNIILDKFVKKEILVIEKEAENEAMREHASQRDAELAAMQQRLTSLELHRERVQTTIDWVRDVESSKQAQATKPMTTMSYEKPRRPPGVPQSFDKSCEFSNIEPEPRSLVGGRVLAFRRESLDSFAGEMMEMFDKAIEYQRTHPYYRSYTAYACLHIWVGGERRLGTRAIGIGPENMKKDLNYLYDEEFANLIKSIEQGEHFYEVVFESDSPCYVHFYFKVNYYPEPGCVANWGENIEPIEKLKLFDLFTAAGDKIPCAIPTCSSFTSAGKCVHSNNNDCILQCARRIWPLDLDSPDESRHKEATEDCIAKLINRAEGKLVIFTPRAYVRYIGAIHSYSDIVIDPLSPVKSLNVIDPDHIYLLHWKGHIGVIENMKPEPTHNYYTKFRPLQKYPNCKKLTVCFDIECYFDPHSETVHVPYLCCACFVYDDVPGNVVEFEGRDCVAQMVEWSAEIAESYGHKSVELVAHNGGGYDFHYILSSMHNPSAVTNILIRNNHFISFKFNQEDIEFTVKDSLNFLLCSLSTAARAFLTDKSGTIKLDKTDFPHHEVRSAEDLQRTFKQWYSVDKNINVTVEKERMLITSEHIMRYNANGKSKRLIEWAREYCVNDVIVLAHVWTKFKATVTDIFNCHIVDQTLTLAGLSFRLFEAYLPVGIKLHHPNKSDFMNMREALIGGRCISRNGLWKDIVCLDVKSLYPAAMAFYDQPYGSCSRVKQEISDKLGIYYVKVFPATSRSENGFFPFKNSSGDVTYSTPATEGNTQAQTVYEAWYTSVDIAIGRLEGHKITPIPFDKNNHVGYCWHSRGKIFKDYICDVLYKYKLQYEQEKNNEKRQVIKIIMNSLWGKFAQKWMDTQYKIVNEDDADLNKECYKIWDTEHMLVKHHKNSEYAKKPVQNGVFVLSWARWHMKLLWDSLTHDSAGAPLPSQPKMIYSDTDSIMVQRDQINQLSMIELCGRNIPVIGSEMGQLEIEHNFEELICVGKKQYMGKYYPSLSTSHSSCVQDDKGFSRSSMKNDLSSRERDDCIQNPCEVAGEKEEEEPIPKYKFRFKGVPQQYIKPEMYAHLLHDPDNKVQIDFLKFKREWGAIHGYIESKTVTAT